MISLRTIWKISRKTEKSNRLSFIKSNIHFMHSVILCYLLKISDFVFKFSLNFTTPKHGSQYWGKIALSLKVFVILWYRSIYKPFTSKNIPKNVKVEKWSRKKNTLTCTFKRNIASSHIYKEINEIFWLS